MNLNKFNRVVVWGLRKTRHSHRYIHKGFYETLTKLEVPTFWIEDRATNADLIRPNTLVFTSGMSTKHLPLIKNAYYILHNVDNEITQKLENHIKLQVHSITSKGIQIDNSIALWDESENTIYQPWGISEDKSMWLMPRKEKKCKEFWVGAVWNNTTNQGNKLAIQEYSKELKQRNIKFIRLGGTRSLSINGISSKKNLELINISSIGASILGNWQKDHKYIPCRAFKNIAAGALPISNSNLEWIFGNSYLHYESIPELIETALGLSYSEICSRNLSTRKNLELYSYVRNLERILQVAKW